MENGLDIPRATTILSTEPREADNHVGELVWRYRQMLSLLESANYGTDLIVLDVTFTIEPGECILVCSHPSSVWGIPGHCLDTLDTRPWWAVRLY